METEYFKIRQHNEQYNRTILFQIAHKKNAIYIAVMNYDSNNKVTAYQHTSHTYIIPTHKTLLYDNLTNGGIATKTSASKFYHAYNKSVKHGKFIEYDDIWHAILNIKMINNTL